MFSAISAVQDWAGADANSGGQQPGSVQLLADSGGLASYSHLPPLCLHPLPAGFHTHCMSVLPAACSSHELLHCCHSYITLGVP